MDVNLTISLIRGQMGVVIEKAVTVAVETVLGEMMKVVSIKFDEFRKEMHAKEKENENVRQMLEISRCQMRAMRKYLSVHATPKDDHHGQPTPRQQPQPPPQQQQLNQFESVRAPEVYPDQPAFIQPPQQAGLSNGPLSRRTVHSQTRTELRASSYPHVSREEHPSTAPQRPKDPTPELVAVEDSPLSEVRLIGSDGTTTLLTSVKQEAPAAVEVECSFEVEATGESGDIITQGRRGDQASPAERALAEQLQPQPRHLSSGEAAEEEPSPPLVSSTAPVVKEEVLDADAVPIKQEPQEVEVVVEGDLAGSSSSGGGGAADAASQRYLEASRTLQITAAAAVPVGQSAAAYYPALASSSSAYAVSQSCLPMVTNVSTATAPIPASSSSLAEGSRRGQGQTQSHLQGQGQGQGQGRPWLRELGLYEQYKQARAELRRRSQLRRKQLEQDLPQALLADLVRERREKTRLRVARWRARRKLQAACLMGAAAAQQGNANANGASSAAVVAAAAAAAQAGQSMHRVSGLHMQVQMQAAAGVAGQQQQQQQQQHHQQQQRLGGSRQLQQQQARQQQGRVGMQYGSRLGGGYAFAAGAHQGLGPLGGEPGGSGGGSGGASGGLSAQAYGSAERFSQQQHRATFLQHSTQGADTDLFQ